MSTQRHLIRRQLIELTVPDAAQAQPLQDEVSRIYRQRLIPLIDQCLTELCDPDKLYRLESLELDIGALDPQYLEEQLVEKVNHSLRRELTAQISRQEHVPGPSPGTNSHLELFALFARTGNLPWWADAANPHLLAENLKYLLHNSPKAWGPLLQELAQESRSRRRLVHQYPDDQLAELAGVLVPAYKLSIAGAYQALLHVLQNSGAAAAWPYFQLRRSLWNNLLLVASLGGQEYATLRDFYQAVFKRMAIELGNLSQALIAELQQIMLNDKPVVSGPGETSGQPVEARIDSRFSEADEVYVTNAGLAILWPFLENFFARVNLVEAKRFKSLAAAQRAAGLLQVVATQESGSPEYLLPLNKILCGLAVEEVFDFGAPLQEAEAEECERLLEAVIAQAPILRDMSVAGFRGTFLLRKGVLSTRDGAWLLQVERETYDIVLERFPWSWGWVKLPWMDAPLRVDW